MPLAWALMPLRSNSIFDPFCADAPARYNIVIKVLEEKNTLLKKITKIEVIKYNDITSYLKKIINTILKSMGIEANLEIKKREDKISVEIFSDNNSILMRRDTQLSELLNSVTDLAEIFKDMQKLDEKSREVMYLRMVGNLSYDEIGEILGKTSNWARVTYYRAKQKIKEENNDE